MGNTLKCGKVEHSLSLDGCYRNITEKRSAYLKFKDNIVTFHEAGDEKPFDRIKIKYGKFGKVHPRIEKITGEKNYNFKLIINYDETDWNNSIKQEGSISDDCSRFYMLSELDSNEIHIYAKISQVFNHNSLCRSTGTVTLGQGYDVSDSTCLYLAIAKPNLTIKTNKLSIF